MSSFELRLLGNAVYINAILLLATFFYIINLEGFEIICMSD